MIQVKYIIQLPVGKTIAEMMSLPDASDLTTYIGIFRMGAESYNCTVTTETDAETNTTTYTYVWPSQASLDEFYTFANSLTNYSEYTTAFNNLVTQFGGSLTRTEQEV
jgi:hypothetical protein